MTGATFFDFDGTLVDTFAGIIEAVQRTRAELCAPPLPPDEVRRHIGWGVAHLLAQCHPRMDSLRPDRLPLPTAPSQAAPEENERLITIFRGAYAEVLLLNARTYPGIDAVCRDLFHGGVPLAVISNKPEAFVRQMLAAMALADPFRLILGGDSLPQRKPDAAPLRHAAAHLGVAIERCVMIGDSRLDMEAARAADVPSCGVTWGLAPEEEIAKLKPTYIVRSAAELRGCLHEQLGIPLCPAGAS
jgi:phosphoglycolate phosphatase